LATEPGNQFHEKVGPIRVMMVGSMRQRNGEGESLKWVGIILE
jgi:hypothetical protein